MHLYMAKNKHPGSLFAIARSLRPELGSRMGRKGYDGRSEWEGNTTKAFPNAFFSDEVGRSVKHVQSPRDPYFCMQKEKKNKNFIAQLTGICCYTKYRKGCSLVYQL